MPIRSRPCSQPSATWCRIRLAVCPMRRSTRCAWASSPCISSRGQTQCWRRWCEAPPRCSFARLCKRRSRPSIAVIRPSSNHSEGTLRRSRRRCRFSRSVWSRGFARPGGESRTGRWIVAGVLLLGAGLWMGSSLRDQRRWNGYLEGLQAQPGIVVVDAGRRAGRFFVVGLRDPLAADPHVMLAGSGLSAERVDGRWELYQALDDDLVLARAPHRSSPARGRRPPSARRDSRRCGPGAGPMGRGQHAPCGDDSWRSRFRPQRHHRHRSADAERTDRRHVRAVSSRRRATCARAGRRSCAGWSHC